MNTLNDYLIITLCYLIDIFVLWLVFRISTFLPLQARKRKIGGGLIAIIAFSLLYLSEGYLLDMSGQFTKDHKQYAQYGVGVFWWFSLAYFFNQVFHHIIWEGIFAKKDQSIVPSLIRNLFDALVYSLALILIIHFVFEKPANGVIAASSIITFILGISARDSLATVFSGISLSLNENIKKGDFIAVNNQLGEIVSMDWRTVTLLTKTENHVIVPNHVLANNVVTNFSRPKPQRALEISVLQSFEHSPQRVKDLLLKSAQQSFLVLKNPAPQAYVSKYEDKGIKYTLVVYTNELSEVRVQNEVLSIVWYAFYREGIDWDLDPSTQIIPHLQLSDDKTEEEIVRHVAILKNKGIFTTLNERELTALIGNAKKGVYGPPEQIVRQGDDGSSLFYIAEGNLEVLIDQEDGTKLKVAALKAGDVFGEMALLTGQKRTATVVATTEVAVYEISKEIISPVIEHRREILNDMSLLLAKREVENYLKKLDHKDHERDRKLEEAESKFSQLISQFFGK
jgi:small-conductance mechanosensitive channel/CRP-like cAMP-binding protein